MIIRTIIPDHINLDHKYYTYAHILENEHHPFYIGIGTQIKKATKYSRAKSLSGRNYKWKQKVKNKNYYVIISNSSNNYEYIKQIEIESIKELGKIENNGLLVNLTDGGEGCLGYKHTPEHIQKLREKYSGSNNPMYGKKFSEETLKKMSQSQKGRRHKESTKEILKEKAIQRGYRGPLGKNHGRARSVKQIDPVTGDIIKIFDTIKMAANELKTTDKAIGKACRQGFKVKKFRWEYVEKTK